jgi:glucose-6-phosphate 1-dehydrogenase
VGAFGRVFADACVSLYLYPNNAGLTGQIVMEKPYGMTWQSAVNLDE